MEGFGFSNTITDFFNAGLFLGNGNTDSAPKTALTTAGTPFGDPAVALTHSAWIGRGFPATPFVIFGARINATPGCNGRIEFYDPTTATLHFSLILDSDFGVLRATRSDYNGYTLLGASPSSAFVPGTWFYLEIAVEINATAGTIVARVNGATVLNVAGISTLAPLANATTGQINMTVDYNGNAFSLMHLYIADASGPAPFNTFLGDVRVLALRPTGAGALTQFAPVGNAANWQNAAQSPTAPAADYNASSTVGASDLFALPALPPDLDAVLGLQVQTLASRDTAGTRALANVLKSGVITATGGAANLGTTPAAIKTIFALDPSTGAAWTVAAVNAAQPGYKITA